MKHLFYIACMIWIGLTACSQAPDSEMIDLLDRVASLKLGRSDYVLGKALTEPQRKIAKENPVEQPTAGLYKFQDKNLFVVAQKGSDRVLILYERYDPATPDKVKELVGNLFFDFGDPTVMAHDKIIYWVYNTNGIMSEEDYNRIKEDKGALKPLATLKLSSSLPIVGTKTDTGVPGMGAAVPEAGPQDTSLYYVLSSQQVLDIISDRKE